MFSKAMWTGPVLRKHMASFECYQEQQLKYRKKPAFSKLEYINVLSKENMVITVHFVTSFQPLINHGHNYVDG